MEGPKNSYDPPWPGRSKRELQGSMDTKIRHRIPKPRPGRRRTYRNTSFDPHFPQLDPPCCFGHIFAMKCFREFASKNLYGLDLP